MKHDPLIYIILFEGTPFMKIGRTECVASRLEQHQKNFQVDLDLDNSYIITAPSYQVKTLERQLLNDLTNDKPETYPFDPGTEGVSEIRLSRSVKALIEIWEQKQHLLNAHFQIYKGIDLSGFRSDLIPNEYYPVYTPAVFPIKKLQEAAFRFANENGKNLSQLYNEILYDYFVKNNYLPKKAAHELRDNYFLVPNENYQM